jgi:hypothetical protein
MQNPLIATIAARIAVMTMAASTGSSRPVESRGHSIDDAAIGVETYKDVVQLSGFVGNQQVKARATAIAAALSGVRRVQNDLVVT